MNQTSRTISESDAEAIAQKTLEKLFENLGFDISTPRGRIEAAGAFRHLMFWYRIWGIGTRVGIGAAATAAVAYAIYKLTGWAGPPSP